MASDPIPRMTPWQRALMAARLFAIDPNAIGGIVVKARNGPARAAWLDYLRQYLSRERPFVDIPAHISNDRLLGGLDLAESLRCGAPRIAEGALQRADNGVALIAGAERLSRHTVAGITRCLDRGGIDLQRDGLAKWFPSRFGVVAIDEALDDEPGVDRGLADRLSLQIDLDGIAIRDLRFPAADGADPSARLAACRDLYRTIETTPVAISWLCTAAAALGVASLRRPAQALDVARAHAALEGRNAIEEADLATAAAFVLAPHATMMPAPADEDATDQEDAPQPETPPDQVEQATPDDATTVMEEMPQGMHDIVVDTLLAQLPRDLLPSLANAAQTRAGSQRGSSGAQQKSLQNGIRTGITNGRPERGAQLSIYATLLAAAPHQKLRAREQEARRPVARRDAGHRPPRLHIRAEDFRIFRRKQRRKTLTIFAVDASGSSALNRLSEAKGAIELLLGECYVRRDEIALVTFRKNAADITLPPTAALARAKRCLASLPGGGATPLASAIATATTLADTHRRRGMTPFIVMLTDGRANIARDGTPGRRQAMAEALEEARRCRALSLPGLVIDTAPMPDERSSKLATELGADYLALPKADSNAIRKAAQATRSAIL
jgi:magnesium chelatase subunit D